MKFAFILFSLISSSVWADPLADQIYSFCQSKGGKVEYTPSASVDPKTGQVCVTSSCSIDSRPDGTDCNVDITSQTIPAGCARAVLKTCGAVVATAGAQSGSQSGAQSGSQSGAQSGSQSGVQSGSQGGATGGVVIDSSGGIQCEYVLSGTLSASHPCIKHCKKHWLTGKQGTERKKCRECVEKYSVENGGDLVVDWDVIVAQGGKKPNKSTVNVGGVKVKTGEIICYDLKTGAIVSRTSSGTLCPNGSSTTPGGVVVSTTGSAVGGVTSGSGNGTVIIQGSANGSLQLPEFCKSNKKKDKTACENWIRANSRFACSSSANPAGCMGQDYYDIQNRYNYDGCVNCGGRGRGRDNSWLGDALGGLFIGGGQALSAYFGGRAYVQGQQAWAGAAAAGFEQCQIHNNNYLGYLQANELPAMSPDQQAAMGCNGFGLNQFAGLGWGGMGAWNGAGFSNGFLGGMMGPFGGYNPYGMGGIVGGAVGGFPGGIAGGIAGGFPGGIAGGYVGGFNGGIAGGFPGGIAGGFNGGIAGGFNGGIAGGFNGGIAGGYVGGFNGGIAGGFPGGIAGGYVGGFNGGMAGGMVNGISIAGGVAAGINGGIAGGFPGGIAGGIAGGFNGGMGPGGYFPGGWGSGAGQWGGQGNYLAASQQSSSYDQMMQAQGVSYQMGMGSGQFGGGIGGFGGGYNAGYSPLNAGLTFGAQFRGGMGGGW